MIDNGYLTITFNIGKMGEDAVRALIEHPHASRLAWGNVIEERDALKVPGESEFDQVKDILNRQISAMDRMANALEWIVRRSHG
jgi:hypothetical protein